MVNTIRDLDHAYRDLLAAMRNPKTPYIDQLEGGTFTDEIEVQELLDEARRRVRFIRREYGLEEA